MVNVSKRKFWNHSEYQEAGNEAIGSGCIVQSMDSEGKTNTVVQTRVLDFYLLVYLAQWGMVSYSGTKGIVGFSRCLLRNDGELDARIVEKSLVNSLPWS